MKRKMNNEEKEPQFLQEDNSVPRIVSFDPEVVFAEDRMTYDPTQLRSMFDNAEGELDLKCPSFDGNSLMDPTMLISYSRDDQEGFYFRPQFPSFEEQQTDSFIRRPVDPSVVPAISSSAADPFKAEAKLLFHPHNLRPKRNSPKFQEFSMLTSDEEEEGDSGEEEEYKEELENEESVTQGKPKKRAYYRKNQHSKEFLAKVEADRLQRKRVKNRELAAKSRQKKKQRMSELEEENSRLLDELAECKALLSQCHCSRQ